MSSKLSWEEIQKQYDKEWVELIDYDWPDVTPFPKSGIVRTHAPNRKDFHKKIKESQPLLLDSALVFVGTPNRKPNTIYVNPFKVAQWR